MNPEAGPKTGQQFVFGVLAFVAMVICLVLGSAHYLQYGLDKQVWRYLLGLVMAFWTAFNCFRSSTGAQSSQNESESIPPPPPFAATAILVGIGTMFFSYTLFGLIIGNRRPLFLVVFAVSGLCIALLLWNYLKLRKEYRNWRMNIF